MATVYKAYDTRLERDVAIKFIRREAIGPEHYEATIKRFEREAKSLSKLAHPNILQVHDHGEHEGSPCLVMAYIPGGTLKQKVGKPMRYPEAASARWRAATAFADCARPGVCPPTQHCSPRR
jgi:serine/threonine-protein kinase